MRVNTMRCVLVMCAVASAGIYTPGSLYAAGTHEGGHKQSAHKESTGVVVQKAGALFIKSEQGATYQLNENQSRRHGHAAFKEGDKVVFTLNENNSVIDAHLVGEGQDHRFVSGKLIHVGKMKQEIKLQTSQGEQVFPLLLQETKTKALEEGAQVTVELNESGTVIDLHREGEPMPAKK